MSLYVSNILISVFVSFVIYTMECESQESLRSLTVVFRHGDRAPLKDEMYPNDPNRNISMEFLGHLTENGKNRSLHLGKLLRERYEGFLEANIDDSTKVMTVSSTDTQRTIMTLRMVLRGLFPSYITENLSIKIEPVDQDKILAPRNTPEFKKMREELDNLQEVKEKVDEFQDFMSQLSKLTGANIKTPEDMFHLYHNLRSETFLNLTQPEWAKDLYPRGKLYDGILLAYDLWSYTLPMRKLNGGMLLEKLIENMKMERSNIKNYPKLHLYSTHEDIIVALLKNLNIYKPHVPDFANALIFELHYVNSKYYVKIYYYNGLSGVFSLQQLPNCDEFCKLSKFEELLGDLISE